MPSLNDKDPQARFWVEAQVSIAKSAVLLGTAEHEVGAGNLNSAAVNSYYSLFHLSHALMWLLPESIPAALHQSLADVRDAGEELPNRITSHKVAEDFLCSGQARLPLPRLNSIYQRARILREYASYGPRVTFQDERPLVGDCSFTPNHLRLLVNDIPPIFVDALNLAFPETAYDGHLAPFVIDGARRLLQISGGPFLDWHSPSVINRAKELIGNLEKPD